MNLTESERNSPSAMSESHSPMATQLAAFTPFPIENAQASDTVTPPARHQYVIHVDSWILQLTFQGILLKTGDTMRPLVCCLCNLPRLSWERIP